MGFQNAIEGAVNTTIRGTIAKNTKPNAPTAPTYNQEQMESILKHSEEKYQAAMDRLNQQMGAYQARIDLQSKYLNRKQRKEIDKKLGVINNG